jgi:hypothetical protein
MTPNMKPLDRGIRAWLGMLLLASPLLELPTYPYNLIGIVPILTAFAGFCPMYLPFSRKKSLSPSTPQTAS